jgi:hypothetical protein
MIALLAQGLMQDEIKRGWLEKKPASPVVDYC